MEIIWIIISFLLGAAIGSFLNVVIDRLPSGNSLVSPSSHCPVCERYLIARDLIPIFSYLYLRGRCRYCKTGIPVKILLVELGTGILFALLYSYYGLSWEFGIVALYCCFFIPLSVIDLERGLLPNKIVYTGIVTALIVASIGSIFSFEPAGITDFLGFELWIIDSVLGGATAFVLFLLITVIFQLAFSRSGMGFGDVKLAGLIGLACGFPLVFVALYFAILGGAIVAGALLITRIKKRKEPIPFGPFLCFAAIATLIWGQRVVDWYLGLAA
jgi:leader peptidase (prepilin peptidase)/N-methyltransferase